MIHDSDAVANQFMDIAEQLVNFDNKRAGLWHYPLCSTRYALCYGSCAMHHALYPIYRSYGSFDGRWLTLTGMAECVSRPWSHVSPNSYLHG